jgi:hypothetical protein
VGECQERLISHHEWDEPKGTKESPGNLQYFVLSKAPADAKAFEMVIIQKFAHGCCISGSKNHAKAFRLQRLNNWHEERHVWHIVQIDPDFILVPHSME